MKVMIVGCGKQRVGGKEEDTRGRGEYGKRGSDRESARGIRERRGSGKRKVWQQRKARQGYDRGHDTR